MFSLEQQPNSVAECLIVKIPRSHATRHTQRAGLLCKNDQLLAEVATYTKHNKHPCPRHDPNSLFQHSADANLSLSTPAHRDRPTSCVVSLKPHTFSHSYWSLSNSITQFPYFIHTNERNTTTRCASIVLTPLPFNTAKFRHYAKAYVSQVLI